MPTMELRRPMLAASTKAEDLTRLPFPMLASPKIDGVRALVVGGRLVSRTLKLIPNKYVQELFGRPEYEGLDGELTVGPANDHNVMQATMSGVMSEDGMPNVMWNVFDDWTRSEGFESRYASVEQRVKAIGNKYMLAVPHIVIPNLDALRFVEEKILENGYEGVMLRSLNGPYKQGRSGLREGYLLKVKRFTDAEAVVLGTVELNHNRNVKTKDERGFSKRSTHKAGKEAAGVLGCLRVKDVETGVEFDVGTGFTWEQRVTLWANREGLVGLLIKYQHFAIGSVDKPRFPIFLGFRDRRDV
jgi:DNA ligase-1